MNQSGLSDAYEILRGALCQERMTGFTNRAGPGGIEAFASQWALDFSRHFPDYADNMNAVWRALCGYSDANLYTRAAMVDRALALIDERVLTLSQMVDANMGITSESVRPPLPGRVGLSTSPSKIAETNLLAGVPRLSPTAVQQSRIESPELTAEKNEKAPSRLGLILMYSSGLIMFLFELYWFYYHWGANGVLVSFFLSPTILFFPLVTLLVDGVTFLFLASVIVWFMGLVGMLMNR